jgi:hypothetical protein
VSAPISGQPNPGETSTIPSVVGAAIELGNCLDLTTQSGITAVKLAYDEFISDV